MGSNFLRMALFLPFLLFSSMSFGIENLDFDCARALQGKRLFQLSPSLRVELGERDILLRGKLYPFHEMGMEQYTGWSIIDSQAARAFRSLYDATFILEKGDRVFLLNEAGEVSLSGYFNEYFKGTNYPQLSPEPDSRRTLIPRKKLMSLFFKEVPAVVIKSYPEDRLAMLKDHLVPQMQAHLQHLQDPSRFIDVGSGKKLELAFFEIAIEGQLVLNPKHFPVGPNQLEGFDIRLRTPSGDYAIGYGHRIFLINEKGEQILETKIRSDVGLDIFKDRENPEGLYQKLSQAKRVIVVGQKQ